ncbi:hypothetical protein BGX28_008180 [Mortierella sp. GBA30]|nr:hypothetical protein BGX28_008180 [Mortierella sp. GBA30]
MSLMEHTAQTPVGPLDPVNGASHGTTSAKAVDASASPTLQPISNVAIATGPVPLKRAGSLTPGGSISKSELSTMAGSIASKLDQYLESTGAVNGLQRQDRASSDSTLTSGSLSSSNIATYLGGNANAELKHQRSGSINGDTSYGSSGSTNGELDEDTALANNLAAISLAAQKISDIYLEPKPKKSAPDGHQVTNEHFEPEKHFYPRVLNAQIHPMVGYFFSLGNERIIARYMHLNPQTNEDVLRKCLNYVPKHFQWAGKYFAIVIIIANIVIALSLGLSSLPAD